MVLRRLSISLTLVALALYPLACTTPKTEPRGTLPPADVAGPPADAIKTESGLYSRVLVRGTRGRHPGPESRVTVHFTGWTTDGAIVEGAPLDGPPATLDLAERMPGWREGVRMMVQGEKRRFWIPPALAYAGQTGKPQGMLVYDIELLSFVD
jgi:FKBP-type peptidyl-prolyl cis-trans isomerase